MQIFTFPYNSSLIQRAPYFTEAHFPYFTLQQIIMQQVGTLPAQYCRKNSTADQDWLVSDVTLQQIILRKWAHYRHNIVEKLSTADQDWLVSDDCSRLVGEVG